MTSAAWLSALAAAVVCLIALAGIVWRDGRRDGKLDAILNQLTQLGQDHETRLRLLEHPHDPRQLYWQGPQHRRR